MNILLSAFSCSPFRGSEPGVGWNWLKELSKKNRIWLLYFNGENQDNFLKNELVNISYSKNVVLIPVSVPNFLNNKYLYYLKYEFWQWKVYHLVKKMDFVSEIDIIHHVTLATWWNCGYLWKLKKPFIFGPISGFQQVPSVGYSFLRWQDRLKELFRVFLITLSVFFWVRIRRVIKNSAIIFTANSATFNKISKIRSNTTILFTEVGLDKLVYPIPKKSAKNESVKLLWVGSLIPRKNLSLIIDSLNLISENINWHLTVVGNGHLKNYYFKKVKKFKMEKKIEFVGQVSFDVVKEEYYLKSDIFLFSSLREATGTVLMEAMASGLPIISLDLHGAGTVLNSDCAILINLITKEQIISDYSNAIKRLIKDPVLRRRLGENGKKRVSEFYSWSSRGLEMQKYYEQVALKK